MSKLVCFIGVIGSGKDYKADRLEEEGFIKLKIADEIYQEAEKELGIDLDSYENKENFKIGKIIIGRDILDSAIYEDTPISPTDIYNIRTGREYLNCKGTFRRQRDKNYWLDQWWKKAVPLLDSEKNLTCSDLRYLNELKSIYECKKNTSHTVKIIFCNYKSYKYNPNFPDPSEKLAQKILSDGWCHEDELPDEYIEELLNNPEL
ncbi:MAG: hypothetical protein ACD_20C00323G0006 [uncultured bacterium]|nr:MAG: hypothetical protein ACD_20C00323G0006 [uncultured bacterium]HBH18953.1 hypothetical protein [Cyanobacteria bacterium UBA9579]